MAKVAWVNNKCVNFEQIEKGLSMSISMNQMTNYGPVVIELENYLRQHLDVSDDMCVIAVNNGAAGLHALVSGINVYYNRHLKYAGQTFSFPCSAQGPCEETILLDVDDEMGLDLSLVDPSLVDGIIVTNLFGHVTNIQKYLTWAEEQHKILLFDNATVPLTYYQGRNAVNYGDGCIISLHHTKPLGFGEGGAIIAKKKYETTIRKCINFGFEVKDGNIKWNRQGSNYKMSEISAVFILEYLKKNFETIVKTHRQLYAYFLTKLNEYNLDSDPTMRVTAFPNFSDRIPFVNCIVVIFPKKITKDHIYQVELNNITARKYYTPLEPTPKASDIFDRIICLPCHIDVSLYTIDRYISLIKELVS